MLQVSKMMPFRRIIITALLLIIIPLSSQMSFVGDGYSLTPNYAKSTSSQYVFPFNVSDSSAEILEIRTDFPNTFELSSVTGCEVKIDSAAITGEGCSLDSTTNEVVINNVTTPASFSSIEISFSTATAKYSGFQTVSVGFYNSSTTSEISKVFQFVEITDASLTCTLTSNSTVVGANSVYTVSFTPSVQIEANSVVELRMSTWGPYVKSNFDSATASTVCSDQCSINILTSSSVELLIYSSLYSGSASNDSNTLTLLSSRNPASTQPITLTINIKGSDGSSIYMTGSTTFAATTANAFSSATFTVSDESISAINSNIGLRLRPTNPINSNSYLRVIYDNDLSVSYLFGFYNQVGATPTLVSGQPSNQLLLSSLVRSSATSSPTLLSLGNFTLTNPPYASKPTSLTFRTEQLVSSTYYHIDQTTISIASVASTITQSSLTPSVATIGSTATYRIWLVNVNALVSGSFIILEFPTQISASTSTSVCSVSISGVTASCSVESNSALKITLSGSLSANNNVTFNVSNVSNPLTTTETDSFTIRTYYEDLESIVDELTTGLTVTAESVPLQSVILTPSSYKVSSVSSYTFDIQNTYPLPSGSTLRITFPEDYTQSGEVLTSFSIAGSAISGCTFSRPSTNALLFNATCIPSEVSSSSTISVVLGNITNPSSFKPTNSFTVETFTNSNLMEFLNNGVTVTMNQTADITFFRATPASSTVNAETMYTFEVNFLLQHYNGDRVVIRFPSEVILSNSFTCNSLTENLTVGCSKFNSETLLFTLSYSNSPGAKNIQFTLSNFTNNWVALTSTFTVQTTTNHSTFYFQEEGTSVVSFQPATLTSAVNNDNNIVLLGTSALTITLSSPFTLNRATDTSLFYVEAKVPTDFTPISGTCEVSYPSASCSQASAQIYRIDGISDFSSALNLKFSAATTFFQTSSAFDLKLYYNGSVVLSNSQLTVSSYCVSPCRQCTVNASACLSCLPETYAAENVFFSSNSTCVNECPDTYYQVTNSTTSTASCSRCNSTVCLNCVNNANECTSCASSKLLHNSTCLSVCPDGFYAFNGECLGCSSPCATCATNATNCLSCVENFFLNVGGTNPNTCVTTCTNTNFLGIDGTCQQCTSDCLTCSVVLGNCTSCDSTNYQLLSNSCVRNCPAGNYSDATGSCVDCETPCLTCTSKTSCESCVSPYFLFNVSTCTTSCPSGYLGVVNQCQACDSSCATCSVTLSNCTSCPTDSFLYQFSCRSECPPLTYPYNRQCTTCIAPCVTCSSSPELCLSCTTGLKLLNTSCVSDCPNSGYIDEETECVACPSNCLTCSTSTNCTLCSSEYNLLQGSCVASCPSNYPIVENRQCLQCSESCLTCDTSADNCTSCRIGYFSYLYTCVESCPFGYFSNSQSYACEDALSRGIVIFPILIISIIIFVFVLVVNFFKPITSLPTTLVALLSISEVSIWIFMASELSSEYKELDIDYTVPIAMVIVALSLLLVTNVAFFLLEYRNLEVDDYVRGWTSNNVNYFVLHTHRYTALVLNSKFFRLIYSRFFGLKALSMPFKSQGNIFPLTTVFTLITLVVCEIPMIVGSFSLVYGKISKDQLFYTSVECLIITIAVAVLALIDIHKSDEFFEESDYVLTRKYLEKIKDASFNQLEDNFDLSKGEGSVEGEHYVSKTGGKFVFSKQDPSSMKELYFEEDANNSINTDAMDSNDGGKKSALKHSKMINIFDPIKEEDEEYYEDLKYSEVETKTKAEIEREKQESSNHYKENEDAVNYLQEKQSRGQKLGVSQKQVDDFDDNKSVVEGRRLKKKWNSIINHRQNLAKQIFNTFDAYTTKELEKIIEPINEDEFQDEGDRRQYKEDPFRFTEYNGKAKKFKKRRRKGPNGNGNDELQKIYLQRLTEKKHKDVFASSQSIKYDF